MRLAGSSAELSLIPVPSLPRLPARGCKRWAVIIALSLAGGFALLVMLGVGVWLAFQSPAVQGWFMSQMMERAPAPAEESPGHPGPTPSYAGPVGDARTLGSAGDLFRATNIWNLHLRFNAEQFAALGPKRVKRVANWLQADGTPLLLNPEATRNGLAGVLGFEFPWSAGDVDFGGVEFTNVAIRYKGNGTFLGAVRSYRKPWKLELDKHVSGQRLAGRVEFNLANLSADLTCLSDTLAYEYFRDAGVPASRTAFSRVFLSITGQETNRLLGLYLLVENPDGDWAREQFGVPGVALFKPVTHELFSDLGDDWSGYDRIYDPKTKLTEAQRRRVIELARLVTHADDAEFARRIGEFVDLDAFARFLAGEVLLANYDGFLSNGQNFLLHLDPRTERFGFIPWDLDHSWGEFPFIAMADERERASVWQPWVGRHRFLERMLAVADFRGRYRAELERQLATLFVPTRLNRRIDEVAAAVRPVVAEWSARRLAKFDEAISLEALPGPRDGDPMNGSRNAWQLKRFIAARAVNVRAQLDGTVAGVVLTRQPVGR